MRAHWSHDPPTCCINESTENWSPPPSTPLPRTNRLRPLCPAVLKHGHTRAATQDPNQPLCFCLLALPTIRLRHSSCMLASASLPCLCNALLVRAWERQEGGTEAGKAQEPAGASTSIGHRMALAAASVAAVGEPHAVAASRSTRIAAWDLRRRCSWWRRGLGGPPAQAQPLSHQLVVAAGLPVRSWMDIWELQHDCNAAGEPWAPAASPRPGRRRHSLLGPALHPLLSRRPCHEGAPGTRTPIRTTQPPATRRRSLRTATSSRPPCCSPWLHSRSGTPMSVDTGPPKC